MGRARDMTRTKLMIHNLVKVMARAKARISLKARTTDRVLVRRSRRMNQARRAKIKIRSKRTVPPRTAIRGTGRPMGSPTNRDKVRTKANS